MFFTGHVAFFRMAFHLRPRTKRFCLEHRRDLRMVVAPGMRPRRAGAPRDHHGDEFDFFKRIGRLRLSLEDWSKLLSLSNLRHFWRGGRFHTAQRGG